MSAERGGAANAKARARRAARGAGLVCAVLLAGCAADRTRPAAAPASYVVRAGDTVYSISQRYGVAVPDVVRWNHLPADYAIGVGQRLLLGPPDGRHGAAAPGAPAPGAPPPAAPPAFAWPVSGQAAGILRRPAGGFGLAIAAPTGSPVRAAAAGRVVYLGQGLRAYGLLVIVRHDERYLTAYAHLGEATVRDGDTVGAGAVIGSVGRTPEGEAQLYFEIRCEGRPVDPTTLLPARPH